MLWKDLTPMPSQAKITHYVVILVDISDRKKAEQEIKQLAFFDPLTRLPNRRLLQERLQQSLCSNSRHLHCSALVFIDLDNFKLLNDISGHDMGDRLLVMVAERLSACIREGDTISRLGGDEFVIILENLSNNLEKSAAQAQKVCEKILLTLNQPYKFGDNVYHSTPSIGITLFADAENSVEDLLKQADIAMYEAKSAGRNTLRFYDPNMQASLAAKANLEIELRTAIKEAQFELHYQAQADGEHGIVSAEALLRWRHPERGLISPIVFITLAEETGLILPIGLWVLETACAQLKNWQSHARACRLTLAINVSARQFRQSDFVEQVCLALKTSDAPAKQLKLELTESLVLDDVEDTIQKMHELRALGVSFSMDDFGTGYSSLSYLSRLPLDQLKIDQSFIRNLPDNANDAVVVQTIITLARSLGLNVIAEGVETEEQRQFLTIHHCPSYQGYLLSKPIPLNEFEKLCGYDVI
ncbi:EAL domain-containing protein [Methylomonas sp. AM2-LC]|uniref:putative bifunctional diguanylate cyclase/phosphodiesterase n=1 Tax=Methylomonas sp. AM2-LC TaxID=3153301 RepID=UPI0032670C1B